MGDETGTAIVQVKGKVKARLEVYKDIAEAELEKQAWEDGTIAKLVEGSEIRKVIVRAPKLVNIVI